MEENNRISAGIDSIFPAGRPVPGTVSAVIFDLGNVLVDFDHTIAARRISRFTSKSPEEIYRLFFDSGITGLFEEGKISPPDFFSRVKEMLSLRLDYAGFLPIWNEIFFLTARNRAVYNLAGSLKNHYRLALLSNINILHFEYLKSNFPVFDPFHHIVTSFEVGLRKPDPLIYRKTLEILKAPAPSVFYTDDRAELVSEASRLGIRAAVFKDIAKLERDMLENGILIGEG